MGILLAFLRAIHLDRTQAKRKAQHDVVVGLLKQRNKLRIAKALPHIKFTHILNEKSPEMMTFGSCSGD